MSLIPGSGSSLEQEMATHSSILTWEIKGQRSLVGNSPWGRKRVGHDLTTKQRKMWDEHLTGFLQETLAWPAWLPRPLFPLASLSSPPCLLFFVLCILSASQVAVRTEPSPQDYLRACCHFIMSDSETPWTVACQSPLSMGFSRQEFWSGLPCPTAGDLPDPGIKLTPPASEVDSLPPSYQGSPAAPTLRIPSERRDIIWSLPD